MTKFGTKIEAENILRELPSVLGVFVREDVEGNPREIHLLVAPGPDVRHLARDIRSLLEERLGVPVDQRVISIAQLTERAADADLPLGKATVASKLLGENHGAGFSAGEDLEDELTDDDFESDELAYALQSVAPQLSHPAYGSDPGATGAEPRLIFHGVRSWSSDGRATTSVELSWLGESFEAEASEIETPTGRLRAAASATLRAAAGACKGTMDFQLEGASVVRVFDREFTLVSALAAAPLLGRRPLPLVGVHPVERDSEEAAVLATLKAIDRVVGLALTGQEAR